MLLRYLPNLLRTAQTHHLVAPTTTTLLLPHFNSFSTAATTTTTTTTTAGGPPEPVHRPNSPLTLGAKKLRKRHQKRYKMRARQTQLNDKVAQQQKRDALARRDAARVKRWKEAAAYKASLQAEVTQ